MSKENSCSDSWIVAGPSLAACAPLKALKWAAERAKGCNATICKCTKIIKAMQRAQALSPQLQHGLLIIVVLSLTPELHGAGWGRRFSPSSGWRFLWWNLHSDSLFALISIFCGFYNPVNLLEDEQIEWHCIATCFTQSNEAIAGGLPVTSRQTILLVWQ